MTTGDDIARMMDGLRGITGYVDFDSLKYLVQPGPPVSKARPRVTGGGRVYVSARQRAQEEELQWALRGTFKAPLESNVAIACIFYRPDYQRIDTDNMLKHVLDCSNGIVVHDDCQVTALVGVIEYDREHPRTLIVVAPYVSSFVRGRIALTCTTCGSIATMPRGSNRAQGVARGLPFYCKPTCRPPREKATVACGNCGTVFERRRQVQLYCSRSCAASSRNVPKGRPAATCRECGAPVSKRGYGLCRSCWLKPKVPA